MTHKHQLGIVKLLVKDLIHLLILNSFKIASSIGQKSKGDISLSESKDSISSPIYRSRSPYQYPINISHKQGFKLSLLLDNSSHVSDNFLHLNKYEHINV